MIITVTGADGPKSSIRLVVHEDCALTRYQYQRLIDCVDGAWGEYEVEGINLHLWDRILFITDTEHYGAECAISMHKKRIYKRQLYAAKNEVLNIA